MSAVPQAPTPDALPRPGPARYRRVAGDPAHSARARGESMLWLCGGSLLACLCMIAGLLLLVLWQGGTTFWPLPVPRFELAAGGQVLGEVTRQDRYRPDPQTLAALPAPVQQRIAANGGETTRQLVRTGNFELTQQHFAWVDDFAVAAVTRPEWALVVERLQWGRAYGEPVAFVQDGAVLADGPAASWALFEQQHGEALARLEQRRRLVADELGALAQREQQARLQVRRVELQYRTEELAADAGFWQRLGHGLHASVRKAAVGTALAAQQQVQQQCAAARRGIEAQIAELDRENGRQALRLCIADGRTTDLKLADIVRAYPANQLSLSGKLQVYLSRWWEFLSTDPREGNEGGVWPAILGTVLMTLIMTICVVPFGVLAALYLREYARAGLWISAVRIAVNNLAGVPSIVFGVFGLGFFCYIVGGFLDEQLYPELLPNPTFGKGALVWASLTLALLTLPVVIVATEEALAAVPRSMREGSYACGASKWQTIRRIVLPRAMPGIMTGAILAMARGAGEVAPLMLVGAAKKATGLPLDGEPPFLHPSRSFMHLGFHIYELGFTSQNSEAAKPMVFTTTLLLIALVTTLNLVAIWLRNRLRRRFVGAQF